LKDTADTFVNVINAARQLVQILPDLAAAALFLGPAM
jgi:hypothetical protein